MENHFNFILAKPAKNKGGDKYSAILGNKEWFVYFPQEISRPKNYPVRSIKITVDISDKEVINAKIS